jgi:putative alpha-1,2-mannosidase
MQLPVLAICGLLCGLSRAEIPSEDLTQYVNPLIGSAGLTTGTVEGSGDVFPGPALPFGVVKLGPDTTELDQTADAFAGYTPDGNGV